MRLKRQTAPDGSVTHYFHDNCGLSLRITDAKGGTSRLRWNERPAGAIHRLL